MQLRPKKAIWLIFVCIALCGVLIFAVSTKNKPEMELSLDAEEALVADVLQQFMASRDTSEDITFDDPQSVASGYIPDGAVCTDVSILGSVVYFDYLLDDIRYIVGYHSDGTIEKTARKTDGDYVYSITSQSGKTESFRISD